jgi:hypothetical protein
MKELGFWMAKHPTATRALLSIAVGWAAWNVFGTGHDLALLRSLQDRAASESLGG